MVHDQLRCLRIKRDIPLKEMAEAIGMKTAGGYARIESGENKLKAEHLPMIAQKFELTIEVLTSLLFSECGVEQTSTN